MKAKDQQELKQVDKDGSKRRDRKAAKAAEEAPKLVRDKWPIRCAPTTEHLAALSQKLEATVSEIDELEADIDRSAQRHKLLKDAKNDEIKEVRQRQRQLSEEVRHGATSVVDCWRGREGDEWVYYRDKEGTQELYREPAADGPQQRCCGKEVARAGELDELLARAMAFVAPPSELTEVAECEPAPWPWGELSWHPFVLARQLELRALLEAADPSLESYPTAEPEREERGEQIWPWGSRQRYLVERGAPTEPPPSEEPEPPFLPLPQLPPAGESLLWAAHDSDRGREHRAGGFWEGYVVHRVKPRSKLLQVRYYNLALKAERTFGAFATVDKAKAGAQRDNDERLRFPGDVASGLLVSLCGHYQLSRDGDGRWQAHAFPPGLDQSAVDLGVHELAEAIAACQADADQRRAEG